MQIHTHQILCDAQLRHTHTWIHAFAQTHIVYVCKAKNYVDEQLVVVLATCDPSQSTESVTKQSDIISNSMAITNTTTSISITIIMTSIAIVMTIVINIRKTWQSG